MHINSLEKKTNIVRRFRTESNKDPATITNRGGLTQVRLELNRETYSFDLTNAEIGALIAKFPDCWTIDDLFYRAPA